MKRRWGNEERRGDIGMGLWLGGRTEGTDMMIINNSVRYLSDICDCIQYINCLSLPLIEHIFLISSYLNIEKGCILTSRVRVIAFLLFYIQ